MIIKFNNKLFELIIKFCKKKKNFLNDPRSRNKQVAYHVRGYGIFFLALLIENLFIYISEVMPKTGIFVQSHMALKS